MTTARRPDRPCHRTTGQSRPMTSTETLVRRILRTYDSATDDERHDGHGWYRSVHGIAADLASEYALSVPAAVGIIAALSPQTSWDLNVRNAYTLASTGTAPTLGLSVRKAQAILAGVRPETVFAPANPERPQYGAKVRAFYSCILAPDTTDAVCLDRHAYAIAHGLGGNPKGLELVGEYDRTSHAYRLAARRRNLLPHQIQAVTWLAWRRVHATGWAARDSLVTEVTAA